MHRSLPAPGGEAQTSPVSWCRLRGRLFRASSDVYNENGLSRQARAWEGVLPSGVGSEGALVGLRGRKSLGTGTSWPKGQPWAGHRAGERRADGCVGGYVRVPSAVISQTATGHFCEKLPQHEFKPGTPGSALALPLTGAKSLHL